MKRQEYSIAVTAKLTPAQADALKNFCNFGGIPQSELIREAILEKLHSMHIPNVAGSNVIEFDLRKDSFLWKVKLDRGEEKVVLSDISVDFIEDLLDNIKRSLQDRNKIIGKSKQTSVTVPGRLIK